jgi:hypothetical protein
MKLEEDTLVTVPSDPPAAFVVRALDEVAPPEPAAAATVVDAGVVDVAAAEDDELPHAASPTPRTGSISPIATPALRLRASRRHCPTRPGGCLGVPSGSKLLVLL